MIWKWSSEPGCLVIENWSTECGDCGYGHGGWAASPALKDPPQPVLSPESRECPGCGIKFTHSIETYGGKITNFDTEGDTE